MKKDFLWLVLTDKQIYSTSIYFLQVHLSETIIGENVWLHTANISLPSDSYA